MAKASGWLKISRKLANDQMWLAEPFTKGQAWVDLLMLATWETHISGSKTYEAGTVYTSIRNLSDRWQWPRMTVWRFLKRLEKDEMVEISGEKKAGTQSGTQSGTAICLKNWAKYQLRGTDTGTENGTYIRKNTSKEGNQTEAAATTASERRVPPGYENDFATWEEYDAWRNQ